MARRVYIAKTVTHKWIAFFSGLSVRTDWEVKRKKSLCNSWRYGTSNIRIYIYFFFFSISISLPLKSSFFSLIAYLFLFRLWQKSSAFSTIQLFVLISYFICLGASFYRGLFLLSFFFFFPFLNVSFYRLYLLIFLLLSFCFDPFKPPSYVRFQSLFMRSFSCVALFFQRIYWFVLPSVFPNQLMLSFLLTWLSFSNFFSFVFFFSFSLIFILFWKLAPLDGKKRN